MLAGKQVGTHRDALTFILTALMMIGFMLLAITETIPFLLALIIGLVIVAGAAYSLGIGNRKWLLIPLLAMLVEVGVAIPFVLRETNPEETPLSIILEAPFWTGLPALAAAAAGNALRKRNEQANA